MNQYKDAAKRSPSLRGGFAAAAIQYPYSIMKEPCVYIMANKRNGTLYVGVTSDLVTRTYQHRNSLMDGFTKKYSCKKLVWYEQHGCMETAILREKQLKAGNRKAKLSLIESMNPQWMDLYESII